MDLRQVDDKENISDLREAYGDKIHIYNSMIPKSVRVKACTARGISIFEFDPKGNAARSFEALSKEVLANAG